MVPEYIHAPQKDGKKRVWVTKHSYREECDLAEDVQNHPFFNLIAKIIGVAFGFLLCCLLFTCCQYKKLETKYEAIARNDKVEVVRKDTTEKKTTAP